jgi:hypothetical protein
MKRIITLITLISFIIYIGGCTKSVKVSLDEIITSDKYRKIDVNQIEFESAILLNEDTIKFNKKSGRLDLNLNLISGILKTGDSTLIGLDTVKYLNHRKFSYFKTTLLVIALMIPVAAFIALSDMGLSAGGRYQY